MDLLFLMELIKVTRKRNLPLVEEKHHLCPLGNQHCQTKILFNFADEYEYISFAGKQAERRCVVFTPRGL